MISRIHQKLGTAGFIIAIVALVAALGGSAWAAAGLNGKEKKEVKKIAKQFAGKKGAKGATGATGATGAPGAPGAKGDAGSAGTPGTNGTNGTNGKSVVIGTATVGECAAGGKTVEVEGSGVKSKVCNGSPWTVDGTLPAGATETGTIGGAVIGGVLAKEGEPQEGTTPVPVSIPIPTATDPDPIYLAPGEATKPGCPGIVSGAPTADAGKLCVYMAQAPGNVVFQGFFDPTSNAFGAGAKPSGTAMMFTIPAGSASYVFGVWAVKG